MAWKMIGEPKTRKLTRSLAEEYSGMTPAPHDRPLNPTRAAIIRKAFDLGKFRTCEWAKAHCAATKQTYRINGKHTSTVLASMNGEFPKGLSVVMEEYECDTLEDVADLYCTFDTRSSARTTGDINLIFAACCDDLKDVYRLDINLAVTGMAYAIWEGQSGARSPEERAQLSVANPDFVLWMVGILSGSKNYKHLRRGAVVAAMFKTYQKAKTAATEFWSAVRDETGTKPDCPDRKLAKFLVTTRIMAKNGGDKKQMVSQRETLVKCIHAWNGWRAGEMLSQLNFHPNAKTPTLK